MKDKHGIADQSYRGATKTIDISSRFNPRIRVMFLGEHGKKV